MDPTPEQLLILAEARTPESLVIEALAGAAKTTTLAMLAQKLPRVPTLCCAFNKSIAVEMAKRMPSFVETATMNSIGHQAWAKRTGKRLRVEQDKMYSLVRQRIDSLPKGSEERKDLQVSFSDYLRVLRQAKSAGYVPPKMAKLASLQLVSWDELMDAVGSQIDEEPDRGVIDDLLDLSITDAFAGAIDYDDQIYMSVCFGANFPSYDCVMVDEAQDLSTMNRIMLQKMAGKRLIAVGDSHQAIYAFRGADRTSMEKLVEAFNTKNLTLSISFRCPKSVVELNKELAPNMTYPDWAIEGKVERHDAWTCASIPDGAAIICRNNAPLMRMALRLLRAGRSVKLRGADVGKSLTKLMLKIGREGMPSKEYQEAIEQWRSDELRKARKSRESVIHDRAACMLVFAEAGKNREDAVTFAEHVFSQAGTIELMTGHKAKGLEWDVVYFLDSFLVPSKHAFTALEAGDEGPMNQERNLKYVIQTRAKSELHFINTDDMEYS